MTSRLIDRAVVKRWNGHRRVEGASPCLSKTVELPGDRLRADGERSATIMARFRGAACLCPAEFDRREPCPAPQCWTTVNTDARADHRQRLSENWRWRRRGVPPNIAGPLRVAAIFAVRSCTASASQKLTRITLLDVLGCFPSHATLPARQEENGGQEARSRNQSVLRRSRVGDLDCIGSQATRPKP